MEIKNISVIYDIDRSYPPCRVSVTHVNDINTRIIELILTQGDDRLEISEGCTAGASIVERHTKRLINNSVACTVNEDGNILIPIDDLHTRNRMDINVEVTLYDSSNTQVLTLPYPLWIRVNPSILDNAEIYDDSLGTVPELLEEAREIIEGDRYVLTEKDKQEIADMVDISEKEDSVNKKTEISNQSQTGDSDTNYPTIGAVRNYVNYVKADLEDYIDDEIDAIPGTTVDSALSQSSTNPVQNKVVTAKFSEISSGKADKATTIAGYGIIDAYNKGEVLTKLNLKANTADVYTKTEIDNKGYLTQHQDISGKEDSSNKVTSISNSPTNAQFPSALAVKGFVEGKGYLTQHQTITPSTVSMTVTYDDNTTETITIVTGLAVS